MPHSLIKVFNNHVSPGFTIVEILIVVTVTVILAGVLWGPLDDLYYDNTRGIKSIIQAGGTRGALHFIEPNITLSNAFLSENQVVDPSGTSWDYKGTSSTKRVLITQNYATSMNEGEDVNGERSLIYSNSNCSTPVFNNYVYFVDNSTLYRRTLKNTTSPVYAWSSGSCVVSSIAQKQTCTSGCAARDANIINGVTDFIVHYHSSPTESAFVATEYTDSTVPSASKTVTVTLKTRSGSSWTDTSSTSTLRITETNGT